MSDNNLFKKGLFNKDRTNEKVVYDLPFRRDGSIERTIEIKNQQEAESKIRELAARIDKAGEAGGDIKDAADIVYLAEKYGLTHGQVNEIIGTKDWLN